MEPIILFEDNHLLAVYKAPGEIMQGDRTGDKPLGDKIKGFIKERDNKPGNVFLGVTHRIDRPVSGVVIFAKTGKALSRMNDKFRNKEVQKTYWAVTEGTADSTSGVCESYLAKNAKQNKSYVTNDPNVGKLSKTEWTLIGRTDHYSLFEVTPQTGRHHQIRVHLSEMGNVIKGDLKYGARRSNPNGSIHLHARSVSFEHPVKNEPITITCPPPQDDPLWKEFLHHTGN